MSAAILLIEDDERLGAQVVSHLEKAGFEAEWWKEGRPWPDDAGERWDLVILDLMLPGVYGLDLLKGLRESSEIPVLILSARTDAHDRVRALKLGADDFLVKPFWPEELIERVKARLRRPSLEKKGGTIKVGALELDETERWAKVKGKPVELTRVELDILLALARRPGAAVTREWLVDNVLDPERDGNERTLDVHVSRLRKKLLPDEPIATVWGIGYRLKAGEDS